MNYLPELRVRVGRRGAASLPKHRSLGTSRGLQAVAFSTRAGRSAARARRRARARQRIRSGRCRRWPASPSTSATQNPSGGARGTPQHAGHAGTRAGPQRHTARTPQHTGHAGTRVGPQRHTARTPQHTGHAGTRVGPQRHTARTPQHTGHAGTRAGPQRHTARTPQHTGHGGTRAGTQRRRHERGVTRDQAPRGGRQGSQPERRGAGMADDSTAARRPIRCPSPRAVGAPSIVGINPRSS